MRDMDAALARGEVQTVRDLGHRIKSAARSVGAFRMADLCEDLERLAPGEAASEVEGALSMVAQLKDLLEQVTQHVMQTTACSADD